MTDTHELVTWYLNILTEEERAARALDGRGWVADGNDVITDDDDGRYVVEGIDSWVATHMALHDPATVLAEIAAKRLTVIAHADCGSGAGRCDDGGSVSRGEFCYDMRLLALPNASRPGYREEWRP